MRQVSQHKDANHDLIVDAYEDRGCVVKSLHRVGDGCPDLLVLVGSQLALVEVKSPKGKLKPEQEMFARTWPVRVVRSEADVAAHVQAMKVGCVDQASMEPALALPSEAPKSTRQRGTPFQKGNTYGSVGNRISQETIRRRKEVQDKESGAGARSGRDRERVRTS